MTNLINSVNTPRPVGQSGSQLYAADSGSANTYAITLNPVPSTIAAGFTVRFLAANANTGASTLNVNSQGAVAIKKLVSTALAANDILAGQLVEVIFDGTNFQIVNPSLLTPHDIAFYAGFDSTMTPIDIAVQKYAELVMSRTGTFTGEAGYIDVVCTGAAAIIDILKNGTSIYTVAPQFAVSTHTLTAGTIKSDGTQNFVSGDRITFEITQIGSTIKGQGVRFTVNAQVNLV